MKGPILIRIVNLMFCCLVLKQILTTAKKSELSSPFVNFGNQWDNGLSHSIQREDCMSFTAMYVNTNKILSRPTFTNIRLRPNKHIGFCLILLLSGDVSMNPGPRGVDLSLPKCETCQLAVRKNRRKVQCSDCNDTYHATCANIPAKEFKNIDKNKLSWYCPACKPEPCGMCEELVTNQQKGVECDKCLKWVHALCGGVNNEEYAKLEGKNCIWVCPTCDFMNFSDTLFNASMSSTTSNRFSTLNDDDDGNTSLTSEISGSFKTSPKRPSNRQPFKHKKKGTPCNRDSLRIMFINFQSIRNKTADTKVLIEEHNPDIVQGVETWLSGDINSAEIFPDSYDVFRKDRQVGVHGGILVACKKDLILTRKEEFEVDSELLWAQLELKGRHSLLIGTAYKPRHNDKNFVSELEISFDKISRKGKGYNILLAGDFNQPNIDWVDSVVVPNHSASKDTAESLLQTVTAFGLDQHVRKPTRKENVLDLVFTNNDSLVRDIRVEHGISDHDIIITDVDLKAKWKRVPRRRFFIRKKANIEMINNELDALQKQYSSIDTTSVQDKWDLLEGEIKRIMEKYIPQKTAAKPNSLPWFNRSHHRLRRRKQRAYNKARKSGKDEDWETFLSCQKELRKSLNKAEQEFVSDHLTTAMKENKKQFWSYMKKMGKSEGGVADLLVNNKIVSDGQRKAEALNTQFASVFTREDQSSIPSLGTSTIPSIPELVIHEGGVLKQLQELLPNKAPGPDQIPPWFLKMFATKLAPLLTDLFQSSIDNGVLPHQWKTANVCAIFKKGSKAAPENYRPVSLTSVTCKVLEHIIHSHIMGHLEQHNVLVDAQHGFRAKHSTETQLIATVDDIAKILDRGNSVHMAILDFAKAFDKVPHERLLEKLHFYGIQNHIHQWLRDFLTSRTQRVACEGCMSSSCEVLSGVPQGTVLGPLLFLLYINDLPDLLENQTRLFADDCLVYKEVENEMHADSLQADLTSLESWQDKWNMNFNASKCSIMIISNKKNPLVRKYTFCGQVLQQASSHPYLGIEIDSKLTWAKQVDNTVLKANRTLGFLRRNLWFCPRDVKATAYKTLVRPVLEYASCAWDPYKIGQINKLEAVQRKAARFVTGNFQRDSSVTQMLSDLNWESLEHRREKSRLVMLYKIHKGKVALKQEDYIKVVSGSRTRKNHQHTIEIPYAKKDVYKYSFCPRTSRAWNALDQKSVQATSVESFRGTL